MKHPSIAMFILILASSSLVAAGLAETHDEHKESVSPIVLCRGVIALTGSDPHTTLTIRQDEERYSLSGSAVPYLEKYQQERLVVVGVLVSHKIGPGFPAKLEVSAFQDPQGLWYSAHGSLLEVPADIVTDDQIRRYFSL